MSYEPQEQDLFLKCLLEANVDGIIAFDRECRYTTWNRAMEHISGVKREDVIGKNAFEMFPCLTTTGEDKYYREALEGKSVVAENRPYIIAQSGCNGFFDGYYSPRHDEQGETFVPLDPATVPDRLHRAGFSESVVDVADYQVLVYALKPSGT